MTRLLLSLTTVSRLIAVNRGRSHLIAVNRTKNFKGVFAFSRASASYLQLSVDQPLPRSNGTRGLTLNHQPPNQ